jgi:hypothetical protein
MRTSVHIPDDLLRRAKKKALAEGRTLTSLIEEGLRTVLADRPMPISKRGLPRTSKATGGLMPGIDPIKISTQTQEMDDLEMLERLARQK